jgi:hypothetical protein
MRKLFLLNGVSGDELSLFVEVVFLFALFIIYFSGVLDGVDFAGVDLVGVDAPQKDNGNFGGLSPLLPDRLTVKDVKILYL